MGGLCNLLNFPLIPIVILLIFNPSTNSASHFEQEFQIEFKNIRLKCRAEFANSCPEETQLIILTMSRRDAFEKRKSIRQTWMDDSVSGEVIRFLVADPSPGEAENVQQKLEEEQRKHGDLVLLHGFNDIYRHIHLKWYGGLKWQQLFCANAKWVMKADDDAIVHLQRLAHWTENKLNRIVEQNPLVHFGNVQYSANPIRDPNHKWFVSTDEFPADVYPNYLSGCVYLSTSPAIAAILAHTHEIDGFYMDDVLFTGILAERANVTLSDQRAHFVWATSFDLKSAFCEDGVPTAFSMWGAEVPEDFEEHYGRLKKRNCNGNFWKIFSLF